MKAKFLKITFLVLCLCCYCGIISAQKNNISVYYQYALKVPGPYTHYPVGFGSDISRNIYKKFSVSAGIDYLRHSDEYNFNSSIREKYQESLYTFYSGVSYPLIDKRLKVKFGIDLALSYFHSSLDYTRYYIPDGTIDEHFELSNRVFEFGIKGKVNIDYTLTDKFIFFIQSGITHYTLSYGENLFINSGGLRFRF